MRKNVKWFLAASLVLILAVILIRTLMPNQKAAADQDEDDEKAAVKQQPPKISIENGRTIIALDARARSDAGIVVTRLKAITSREQMTAPAVVLSAQPLVTARANYVTAQNNLEKAHASVDVAQQEYDRLRVLYQGQQNTSQKSLQAEQGILRSDEADLQAAEQNLTLQTAALRQSWGDVVAKWVSADAPSLDTVLDQSEFLVQVTLPAGAASIFPATISLDIPGSSRVPAKLVSLFPQVDPRIQGVGLLYVTPWRVGLAPGLNLMAHFSIGSQKRGVLIPQSAIVWWEGKAWAYLQTASDTFVQSEVPTDMPVPGGWFAAKGFTSDEKVVTTGAQQLLSAQFTSQAQASSGDTD